MYLRYGTISMAGREDQFEFGIRSETEEDRKFLRALTSALELLNDSPNPLIGPNYRVNVNLVDNDSVGALDQSTLQSEKETS